MSPSTRRLMKEAAELSTSPSPHFHAAPVSDSNLYDWHFTLAGPPAPSPYANGIYHGRIVLPPTYPLRPPSFRFLTPSGRFEVNREICLSISGHHEETWQPAWGIRTALIAIRSFMDGDVKGQVGGLEVGDELRREYAVSSREWVCEVCARCNREILEEWVEVGCQGLEEKKKKDENENGGGNEGENDGDGISGSGDGTAGSDGKVDKDESASDHLPTPASPPSVLSNRMSVDDRQQQQQQPPVPVPSVTSPAPVPAQPQPVQQPHASVQSDGPWLDRAIIGVLVALVVMILRRVALSEDSD